MKNIEKEIAKIRESVRKVYNNDNDAPRLLAEMMKEFPHPRGPRDKSGMSCPMSHNLG